MAIPSPNHLKIHEDEGITKHNLHFLCDLGDHVDRTEEQTCDQLMLSLYQIECIHRLFYLRKATKGFQLLSASNRHVRIKNQP